VSASAAPAVPPASLGLARGGAALVTGASSGIGETFARTLAARGVDLLLTALPADGDRLDALAAELSGRHGVRALAAPVDLGERDGPGALRDRAAELGFTPDLLVNSAGLGAGGRFAEAPLEDQLRMVHVNTEALVRLCGLFLPAMAERGAGAVVNVASTAAFQPMPYFAVYAASKAFVLSFGEALWAEHHAGGVRVVTVCSGPVATAFHDRAGAPAAQERGARGALRRRYMTAQRVVDQALEAVQDDQPLVVLRMPLVGLLYRPATLARGVLPLRRRLKASERLHRWIFEQQPPGSGPDR
jgi:short-subunit dehydrogenase